MKEREKKIVKYIEENTGIKFELTEDEFSIYDAQNKDYIVELKIRERSYDETVIEVAKCYNLLQLSQAKKKIALYIVGDSDGVHIFNLNELKKFFLKSEIVSIHMPFRTELKGNEKIEKYVYRIPKRLSKYKIEIVKQDEAN